MAQRRPPGPSHTTVDPTDSDPLTQGLPGALLKILLPPADAATAVSEGLAPVWLVIWSATNTPAAAQVRLRVAALWAAPAAAPGSLVCLATPGRLLFTYAVVVLCSQGSCPQESCSQRSCPQGSCQGAPCGRCCPPKSPVGADPRSLATDALLVLWAALQGVRPHRVLGRSARSGPLSSHLLGVVGALGGGLRRSAPVRWPSSHLGVAGGARQPASLASPPPTTSRMRRTSLPAISVQRPASSQVSHSHLQVVLSTITMTHHIDSLQCQHCGSEVLTPLLVLPFHDLTLVSLCFPCGCHQQAPPWGVPPGALPTPATLLTTNTTYPHILVANSSMTSKKFTDNRGWE